MVEAVFCPRVQERCQRRTSSVRHDERRGRDVFVELPMEGGTKTSCGRRTTARCCERTGSPLAGPIQRYSSVTNLDARLFVH